ncbi:MAG: permease-like cell division protein FtsX [Bacteroidetes bacterium]|nr:permease-like cell division protein FtsX [Bacteroidota bacterium]MCB0855833.1 permease-like cell division protein FtsX [Bacteroidota bacterium]
MASSQVPYQVNYWRKKSRSNYITSLIFISVILFLLGLFIAVLLLGESVSNHTRKLFEMKVFMYDGTSGDALKEFEQRLGQQPFVESFRFVSKEEAGKYLMEKTGEDTRDILDGINPLMSSFNLIIRQEYIQVDSLRMIRKGFEEEIIVSEVVYPEDMILDLTENIFKIRLAFLGAGIILLGIVFYLIFGAIRLSIYAQRLTIRSMQLIGATQAFIRRPFLLNGLVQGFLGSLIAALLVYLVIWLADYLLASIDMEFDLISQTNLIGLLVGIVLLGPLLGLLGSALAVNRYLNRNLDELI